MLNSLSKSKHIQYISAYVACRSALPQNTISHHIHSYILCDCQIFWQIVQIFDQIRLLCIFAVVVNGWNQIPSRNVKSQANGKINNQMNKLRIEWSGRRRKCSRPSPVFFFSFHLQKLYKVKTDSISTNGILSLSTD